MEVKNITKEEVKLEVAFTGNDVEFIKEDINKHMNEISDLTEHSATDEMLQRIRAAL